MLLTIVNVSLQVDESALYLVQSVLPIVKYTVQRAFMLITNRILLSYIFHILDYMGEINKMLKCYIE